jgi:hypothetical protein
MGDFCLWRSNPACDSRSLPSFVVTDISLEMQRGFADAIAVQTSGFLLPRFDAERVSTVGIKGAPT